MLAKCDCCEVTYANHNSIGGLCGICLRRIKGYIYGTENNTSQVTIKTLHHKYCWDNHCIGLEKENYNKTYRPEKLAAIARIAVDHYRLRLDTPEKKHLYKTLEKKYRWAEVYEYRNTLCPVLKRNHQ